MYIKSLELENIRSYKKELIEFQTGINFLSGDIGSGKSSILQAIEFTLFGFKRGDLEGIHLLRKGKTEASVKLNLQSNNEEIEIFRKLKKSKTTKQISQENGYIKIGNSIEELSPQELNSKIFEILNFPAEFISKDKNLIYRFTIYTPQEQLKEILYSEYDKRLEVIRKIFKIDKYKQLKDSIGVYLTYLKEQRKIFETKIEDKNELKEKQQKSRNDLEQYIKALNENKDKQEKLEKNIKSLKEEITKREELLEKIYDIKTKLEKNLSSIEEIKENSLNLLKKQEEKKAFIKDNRPENLQKLKTELEHKQEKTKKQIEELKEEKTKIETSLKDKKALQEQKEKYENKIQEINIKKSKLQTIEENFDYMLTKCQIKDLENKMQKIMQKNKKLKGNKEKLDKEQEERYELKAKYSTLENSLKEMLENTDKITHLDECPSCLQKISTDYRINIKKTFEEKKKTLKEQIDEIKIKIEIKETNEKDLKEKIKAEEDYEKEISIISEKIKLLSTKAENEKKEYEKASLIKKELKELNIEDTKKELELLEEKLKNKEKEETRYNEINDKIIELNNNQSSLLTQKEKLLSKSQKVKEQEDEIKKLNEELEKNQIKINKEKDIREKKSSIHTKEKIVKEKINCFKKKLEEYFEEEKNLLQEISKCKVNIKTHEILIKEIEEKLNSIKVIEKKIERNAEISNFLVNNASQIAEKLERTILTKYYVEFNESFESIFKELIEDSDIDVRLDENFSPVVEQNGFDTEIKNLSGGEKSSLAVAYRLGLKKIIETNLANEQKLSLLILDEPTDGFSQQQVTRLGNILKESNLNQIILVSHDEKIESIADTVIRIEKINHVSKIS